MSTDRYAEICAGYRWDVPARFNIADACCRRWADDPTRLALQWEDESGATAACTFAELQRQANRLSNALAALGVGRGDKVALMLPQRPETVVGHIAVYQLGAIAVPLSFLFGPDALAYRLVNSEAKVALVDPQSLPNLVPIRDAVPGLAHVVGVAGARESFVTSYEALLARASDRFDCVPTVANMENCLSTFAAPQAGQVTTWSSRRTSSSKCSSHSMHAYS